LSAINTKLLLAILGALAVITGLVIHTHNESQKAAAEAAKAAAILQQQKAEADAHKRKEEEFRQKVEAEKRRHDVSPGKESKTWQTYVP
jgi:Flp pilus assembly protein TadG